MTDIASNITWLTDWSEATTQARATRKPIIVDVYQDNCGGCVRLDEETLGNPAVSEQIAERFIPVKLHLFNDRAITRDWQIFWTPTVLFADRSGKIRYRSVNYLPVPEFLDIMDIGEAMSAMRWMDYETAIARLKDVEARHPDGPLTAEAIYWRGITEYFREGNNPESSRRVWKEIQERFPDSIWAKRQP